MNNFLLLEIAGFAEWKKADKKGKARIVKAIASAQAKLLIKKINEDAQHEHFCTNNQHGAGTHQEIQIRTFDIDRSSEGCPKA